MNTRLVNEIHPLLEVRELTKSYGSVKALSNVSLSVYPGEVLGLCGHNGAGKSTLVRVLVGLTQPDEGEIRVAGEVVTLRNPKEAQARGIAIVDQELSLVPMLSVEDNIFLGGIGVPFLHRRQVMSARARSLLDKVGLEHVSPTALAGSLPIGERQLVEVSRLLGRNASVLVLDEPTAALSESEMARVFRVVREVAAQGHSVVYVSHRLSEVLSLCDRVSVFRDGLHIASHAVGELDRQRLVSLIVGELEGEMKHLPLADASAGDVRLRVSELCIPNRVPAFGLELRRGQIIGLAGQVDSGTSDVLRAIAGLVPEARGLVAIDGVPMRLGSPRRAATAGVSYTSNDRQGEGLFLGQSVERNLVVRRLSNFTRFGFLERRLLRGTAGELADVIGLPGTRLRSPVRQLSGGNQQKVLIGRSLKLRENKVLLLDDPSRGVDVGARAEIHRLLRQAAAAGEALLFTSTEMDELLALSDVIVTVFAGRIVSVRPKEECTAGSVFAEMTLGEPASIPKGNYV